MQISLLAALAALATCSALCGPRSPLKSMVRVGGARAGGAVGATRAGSHQLKAMPGPLDVSLPLADLDADTLGALGDIQELNSALDGALDAAVDPNAVGDILQKVVASPFIVAVPIGAGLLVALGLGFFIFSWGSPKE